jgi:hypothetical protein
MTAAGACGARKTSAHKWSISANPRSISATGINALTTVFSRSDRRKEPPAERRKSKKEDTTMKKFGFAAIAASGLAAAILGLAAPAQAAPAATAPIVSASFPSGVDHLDWLNDIQPNVNVPDVDTSVRSNP